VQTGIQALLTEGWQMTIHQHNNVQRIVESTIVHNYGPDWQAHQDLPTALGEAQTVGNM
jgi:hypothetical protein